MTWQPSLFACAACFGKSDSNMAQGMNAGIFALLFVIAGVLGGVAGFFVYLAKRASMKPENVQVAEAQVSEHLEAELEKV
jgi:hypothetical protein